MALELNADKQIIQSEQLKIKNSTSVRIDLGDGADEKAAIFGNLTADADKLVRIGINTLNPQYELDVEGHKNYYIYYFRYCSYRKLRY